MREVNGILSRTDTAAYSSRVTNSLAARETMSSDFFGGWESTDLALFARYGSPKAPENGFVIDFFGVKTSVEFVPWAKRNDGMVFSDPPIPDDGVRAEAIEYFALLDAFSKSCDDQFCMIELGASYAPWACTAGVLAIRHGKKQITLRAVEASSFFHRMIPRNFEVNGLNNPSAGVFVDWQAIHGAVGIKPGNLFFPVVSSAYENGGQAASEAVDVDYCGRSVAHEPVPVRMLDEILEGVGTVDLLHCDIQGSEEEVLIYGAALLTQKVRHMFIGTHSRKIEGLLIDCFHRHGWILERERPVAFQYRAELTSVTGMTTRDGGQYWTNNRLVI